LLTIKQTTLMQIYSYHPCEKPQMEMLFLFNQAKDNYSNETQKQL